jgi:cysteine-rich repeat protein
MGNFHSIFILTLFFVFQSFGGCGGETSGDVEGDLDVQEDILAEETVVDLPSEDLQAEDVEEAEEGCESNAACDDGEPCNGQELCSIEGRCFTGTPPPDGEECAESPRSICLAGLCQVSTCGDGYVDAGSGEQCEDDNLTPGDGCENDCAYTCTAATQAEDCVDGVTCTLDVCDEETHICINPEEAGWCLIAGTCYEDGESNPLGWCQWCKSTVSSAAWTDKVMQKLGSDVRITSASNLSEVPSLVWTGSEFGVAWEDQRDGWAGEIYFARIDSSGSKMGSDIRITSNSGPSFYPSIVWTGSEFGVAWEDQRDGNNELYFVRIDSSGSKIGNDVRITNDPANSYYTSLVWTGSEFGAAWEDYRDENVDIYFARIDSPGSKIGSDVRVTSDSSVQRVPFLTWTGSEFGVAWQDFRDLDLEIYFARLDSSGSKIGSDAKVTSASGDSRAPFLAWTGSEFGVAWEDDRDGNFEIYFARIDSSGSKMGSDVRITSAVYSSLSPSLAWTGSEFGMAWQDLRDGSYEIYFARIDSSGSKMGSDVRITDYSGESKTPSIAWTGSEFGVAWDDSRDDFNEEIYFARIGCLP